MKTPQEIKDILKTIDFKESHKNEYIMIVNEKGFKEPEHRYVWRMKYGNIPIGAVIHHINENKKDNKIENLMMFPNANAHMGFHKLQRRLV